ncbi:hypothetical protein [Saccharothrix xinjiangensis]|uniref:Uncharacterized protein n=1 Tax=Saccharothrix xinjiangensis TaxID=204798 RepID=A0ABV9Y5L8_9PSEU
MSFDQQSVPVPEQTRAGSATVCRPRPERDPLPVLTAAVDAAIAALPPTARADALEPMLTDFALTVAPVQGDLAGLAAHDRRGVLKIAQGYLGNAFTHAVTGDVDATRAALIAARASLFHLGGGEEVTSGADWRA